jgi:CHAD domain-containing protein
LRFFNATHRDIADKTLQAVVPVRARMKDLAAEAKQLADLLGDDQDLVVLRATLANDSDALGDCEELAALSGLAERRQDQLRAAAQTLGWRLFAEKPADFRRRMHRYWQASQTDALRWPVWATPR